jgi:hypothetical protein
MLPTGTAMVLARGFCRNDRTCLRVHHYTATVREVDVPYDRAVLVLQNAVIDRVARACSKSSLLGLLLSHLGLRCEGCLVSAARATAMAAMVLARGFARYDRTCIAIHDGAAPICEVDVIDGRAVPALQAGVVHRAAGVSGNGGLLGLLLGYLSGNCA